MLNLLVYLNLTIDLLNLFLAKNLFVIYSSNELNGANLKIFNRQIQDNYPVSSYYYDVAINRNNSTEVFLGANYNPNTSYIFAQPLFLVYLFDEDLHNFNFHLANELSSSKWMIFVNATEVDNGLFDDVSHRPDFSSEVFVVSSCEESFDIEINEIYYKDIKVDDYRLSQFAVWNNQTGLHVVQDASIFTRRTDMSNITFTVSTLGSYPLTVLLKSDTSQILGGYFGYTWNALEEYLKFKTLVVIPTDNTWGKPDEYGHWDGIIGQVIYNEADVALMDLLMIPERRAVVHFFNPIVSTRQLMILRKDEIDYIQWLSFLRPLNYKIWIGLFSLIVGLPIFMLLFNYKNDEKKNISECCLDTLRILCQQSGIKRFPESSSGFLFYTLLFYVGYIILLGYSAALISFLTIVIFIFPFGKINDIYKTRYNLLMYKGSGLLSTIMRSSDKIYRHIIKYQIDLSNLPSAHYEDALDMVCNSTKPPYVLYAQKYPIEYVLINYQQKMRPPYCPLVYKTAGTTFKLGFVGSYNSPYMDLMNYCLIRFHEYGIIHRLRNYEQPLRLTNIYNGINSVKITSVFPMVLILIVGIVLSFIIFIIEIYYAQYEKRKLLKQHRKQHPIYLH